MKIVFMGTPEFAVASLDAVVKSHHKVQAVVTVPDKPAGRGLQPKYSAVKEYALQHQLPLLQPDTLKSAEFILHLKELEADVFVIVAFKMLPEEIYSIPLNGAFNVHASLLPDYRGAAPIHWAVMNGEKKTGVTTFFLNKEIDKGDIIAQFETEIGEQETTGELYGRLKEMGAELAVLTLNMIERGCAKRSSQENFREENLKKAPKILKEDTLINWHRPAKEIINQIRGLAPLPGAYTRLQSLKEDIFILKCFKAILHDTSSTGKPGTFFVSDRNDLVVNTLDFQISLENVQFQGKKIMKAAAFIQGFRFENFTNIMF